MLYIFYTLRWKLTCTIYSILSGYKVYALCIQYSQVTRYMLYVFCTFRLQGVCSMYFILSCDKVQWWEIGFKRAVRIRISFVENWSIKVLVPGAYLETI